MNEEILKELKAKLNDLHEQYLKEYSAMPKNADYFLLMGQCSGIGEALDLIDEYL